MADPEMAPSLGSLQDGGARTKPQWDPSGWFLVFDPVGFLGWGTRYGVERALTDHVHVTEGIWTLRNRHNWELIGALSNREMVVPNWVAMPGMGARYFFAGADARAGFYTGVYTELVSFDDLTANMPDFSDNSDTEVSGQLLIPQIDIGYRIRVGARFSFDLGATVGVGLGNVRAVSRFQDGSIERSASYGSGRFMYNFVAAFATPVL